MLKRDIATILKGELRVSNQAARKIIDAVLNAIVDGCVLHGEVSIHGFGKFRVVKRPAKSILTPLTKQRVNVPARKALKFTASRSMYLP